MTSNMPYTAYLVTTSISLSIQDVQELHALSPPLAGQYALGAWCGEEKDGPGTHVCACVGLSINYIMGR